MNAFFKGAGTVLRKSWAWSLLLVFSSALLVWFFGPLLAVDDYRFWQSATSPMTADNAGDLFAPYQSKQKEVGVKVDLGDFTEKDRIAVPAVGVSVQSRFLQTITRP